ncbi:PREDICTED: vesicle transport protein SEC20 isoform X1 [Hipposideros armiger]|uniref:Vesicle transport protein SEC20 isoform X1 n=1 Tax=Hipposideros armiger TaxID=186990 RepID=A0A8B7QUT9_HIPAR|nr:PREDICTED: vesicle transport protein SEC20 isoform X1 [Hipposideros armiger]
MAAAQDVHVRICNQEIVKFDLEVKALIQDIRDCSGPLSALTELNTKVKEKFQQLRHRIQELEQLAKEQDRESEKQALLQEVESHKKQMLSNQTSWRKANLTCKMAIDNVEKAELLQGGDRLRQRKTAKESLAQTSSTITESLMGISRMMSQQVQQSEEAVQSLGRGIRDHQRWCHSSVSTADAAGELRTPPSSPSRHRCSSTSACPRPPSPCSAYRLALFQASASSLTRLPLPLLGPLSLHQACLPEASSHHPRR